MSLHTSPTAFSNTPQDESLPPTPDNRALPAPGQGTTTTLDVSGNGTTVKLDHLGPLVVNVDGTMSRINNWSEMTDAERDNTLRIVSKRNKTRLDALKAKQSND